MNKPAIHKRYAFVLAAACALGASAAQAANVQWSIGINAPPIGTVISNGPVYGPAYGPDYGPAYYGPPPVYVAPPYYRHRHHRHSRGYYGAPVVVAPAPIIYGGWRHPQPYWHGGRGHRDEYGSRYNDGRWAPVPRDERRHRH